MELSTAIQLIQAGVDSSYPQHWADLGAGAGLFTSALSSLLHPGSRILAVDRTFASTQKPPSGNKAVAIETMQANFLKMEYQPAAYHGIIMANSLHFVADKAALLLPLQKTLVAGGRIIVVEYNMDSPNSWVPFPISLTSLDDLLGHLRFPPCTKLNEVPSVYQRANIYSALIAF